MNRMASQLDERIQTVLRQQNEREAMLSSMEEGVLAINNEGTILSLNQACATLLGEEPAKLQGRGIYEVIRKADLLKFIESALASASPVEGELQIRGAQDRWVSAHGTVLHDAQRGKIGVLIVLHDITRLRHLEEVRRDFVANVRTNCGLRSRRSRASSKPSWTARLKTGKTPIASCRSCCGR